MNESPPATWIRPILGRADDMRAEVWLRCGLGAMAETRGGIPVVATGTLTGPECATAATLTTTVPLVDQGTVVGQPALARGVCTEPGFWTPELPNLYRAEVVLRHGDEVVAAGRRMIGLRRLGVKGRSIYLDGRRYVPRGVPSPVDADGLEAIRRHSAVAVAECPSATDPAAERSLHGFEGLLTHADRIGVAVVMRLSASNSGMVDTGLLRERLEVWAAHPSAFLVILPVGLADAAVSIGRRRGSMLLGLEVEGVEPPPPLPDRGIDTLVVTLPEDGVPHRAWQQPPPLPHVAAIRGGERPSPTVARAACDRLQSRLAAWANHDLRDQAWDWAGYLVT